MEHLLLRMRLPNLVLLLVLWSGQSRGGGRSGDLRSHEHVLAILQLCSVAVTGGVDAALVELILVVLAIRLHKIEHLMAVFIRWQILR